MKLDPKKWLRLAAECAGIAGRIAVPGVRFSCDCAVCAEIRSVTLAFSRENLAAIASALTAAAEMAELHAGMIESGNEASRVAREQWRLERDRLESDLAALRESSSRWVKIADERTAERDAARWADETRRKTCEVLIAQRDAARASADHYHRQVAVVSETHNAARAEVERLRAVEEESRLLCRAILTKTKHGPTCATPSSKRTASASSPCASPGMRWASRQIPQPSKRGASAGGSWTEPRRKETANGDRNEARAAPGAVRVRPHRPRQGHRRRAHRPV